MNKLFNINTGVVHRDTILRSVLQPVDLKVILPDVYFLTFCPLCSRILNNLENPAASTRLKVKHKRQKSKTLIAVGKIDTLTDKEWRGL